MKSKSILRKQVLKLERLVEEARVMANRAEFLFVEENTFETWADAVGEAERLNDLENVLEGVKFQLRNYDFLKECEEREKEEREMRLYHIY